MERCAECSYVINQACADHGININTITIIYTHPIITTISICTTIDIDICISSSISVINGQPLQMLTVINTFRIRQHRFRKEKENSLAIFSYNKGKSGIDSSDQMASHTTSLRKEVKWYRKLATELIL